ncbi:MAG: exodeoxyribonuclease VII large subunit [Bacteroidales bacterium]|nr:exodeoxyribonuclease VII large subunit [Bacteroidales bacterium]
MGNREIITLTQLQERIRGALDEAIPGKYWLRAETGEVKVNSTGHCYLELIDKEREGGSISAKIQAVIWGSTYRMLKPYFETATGRALSRGITVLVSAQVQYSPVYGLSLVISDIDPSYTIGEQELIRQKTILRLKEEGMFGVNTSLLMPLLPRRLAVVSSESAAGYRDFVNHLEKNDYGFNFSITLFSAPLQGDSAPAGIIAAMERVAETQERFDLLLILRGGGAAQDLVCFDDYNLAINIAQFPLPVITAIGHDHDHHIADMVSHTFLKTPTAAAAYIIDLFVAEEQQLIFLSRRVSLALQTRIQAEITKCERIKERISNTLRSRLREEEHKLEIVERRISSSNPLLLLYKGYTLAVKDGRRVRSVKDVSCGDAIMLILTDGFLNCTVKSKENGREK